MTRNVPTRTQERMAEIKSFEAICLAGRFAADLVGKMCESTPDLVPRGERFRLPDIARCRNDLEKAYLIRIFAVFEVTLRDYWRAGCGRRSHPRTHDLLNALASRLYVQSDVLANAHSVRAYRNSLLHGGAAPSVQLHDAKQFLCRFLASLPRMW